MPRKYRYWSAEQKLEIITPVMNGEISMSKQALNYEISSENIFKWIKKYKEKGFDGLINKNKPGNPLAKYARKTSLTEIEELEYENMKLRIENERLKKGYLVKGDGTALISKR